MSFVGGLLAKKVLRRGLFEGVRGGGFLKGEAYYQQPKNITSVSSLPLFEADQYF